MEWRKLKSQKATFPEIVHAVASSDKKRFALLHIPSEEVEKDAAPTEICTTEQEPTTSSGADGQENSTQKALTVNDPDPVNFLIRATQGHSIKTVDAAAFLEKLSLSEEDKLPSTVVHGTYHSSWPAILESGGLRCMGRNHVHFATGPTLESVLPLHTDGTSHTVEGLKSLGLDDGRVISGMRRDAQVLIYINLQKALEAGCPFWRSENGVILSEGLASSKDDGNANQLSFVPLEFFDVVVERKAGLGKIWVDGKSVQELPAELTKKWNPKVKNNEKGKKNDKGKNKDKGEHKDRKEKQVDGKKEVDGDT